MSRRLKPYTIDDVNKKILKKPPAVHLEHEYLGPENRYRDDDYKIYLRKREEFFEAANKYRGLNRTALFNNKTKLDSFSDGLLPQDSTECECQFLPPYERCYEATLNKTGLRLRKRIERPIHEVNLEQVDVCSLEPWLKRFLKLSKFIRAARTIVIYNRLVKNLEKLRGLNGETIAKYEALYRKYDNISYPEIFEKFVNN